MVHIVELIKKLIKDKRTRYIVTGVHILCTFLWAGRVLKNVGVDPVGTKAVNSFVSDGFERVMTFALTEAFAVLLIYFLWRLVFRVLNNFKKEYLIFIGIFVLGGLVVMLSWPNVFTWIAGYDHDDNMVAYSYAVRLVPDYWHSIYQSVLYGAALLVLPLDFMITLTQWTGFVYMVSYIYFRAKRKGGKLRFLVFLIFLLPSTFEVMSYGHRIMIYIILALVYTAYIFFDFLENRERSLKEDIFLAVFGAFLSVYRSEGLVIAVLLYGIYVIFHGNRSVKGIFGRIGVFAGCFLLLYVPQKIGSIKYYGEDYSIMNSFRRLQIIFNSGEANLSYKGVEEDIAAIEAVTPVSAIAEYGVYGYRVYNYSVLGHADMNQSMAAEGGKAYIKAYHSILLHNPKLMAKITLDSIVVALSDKHLYKFANYTDEHHEIGWWEYGGWDSGQADMFGNRHTAFIKGITEKLPVYKGFRGAADALAKFWHLGNAYMIAYFLMFFGNLALFVKGLADCIVKRDKTKLGVGFLHLSTAVLLIATVVAMPEPYSLYFMISGYLLLFMLFAALCGARKAK